MSTMNTTRPFMAPRWLMLVVVALLGAASGCVTNPATGKSEFSLMSRAQEIALGQEGDQQIVAQFGVYDDAAIARYVDSLGQALAAKSEDPSLVWTFRVLDSPVINAFALPGGFIYVTRGLLEHLENEAQLAVVLGHEIGHVTARHAARQYTSQQLAGLAVGVGAIVFEEVRPFLGEIETGLTLLFLKYSRDDERQADELGVRYATRAGYVASEGAEFFETLDRIQNQQQGGSLPSWASTHPEPAEREETIRQLAATYAQQNPGVTLGGTVEANYVPRLENLVYGPDPRQGFVQANTFYHPSLRFQFPVPSNWVVANMASQVQLMPNSQNPQAAIVLQATSGGTPQQVASAFVQGSGAQVLESGATTVNGLSAYALVSDLTLEGGGILRALSYFIAKDNSVYVFHGYTAQSLYSNYAGTFQSVFTGFRTVTDASVLNVQPYRIDAFTAASTAPFSSLVTPQPNAGATIDYLAIMNQVAVNETIPAGSWLKQVR